MSGNTRLTRLFASYACVSLATGLPWPLLLVLVFDRYGGTPHGAVVVGLAGAARMAPYVALSWAAGVLGDRIDRRRLLLATLALRTGFLTLAAVSAAGGQIGWAVGLAALAVTAGVPAYPCVGAALPALAGADRDRATDVLVTVEVSAWVIGPALGGLLVAVGARASTLWVAAGLAAVAWALMHGVALPARQDGNDTEESDGGLVGTLRAVVTDPVALGALGLAALLNVIETTTGMALLPLSREVWHHGDDGFGLAVGCLGAGALGAPLLARWVRDRGLVLLAGLVAAVAAIPVVGPALPLLVVAGAAGVVVEGAVTRTLQDAVPDRLRAGALGIADTVMVTACLVGTVAGPVLARSVGARTTLVLAASACLLPTAVPGWVASWSWVGARGVPAAAAYDADREPTRPDQRGAPAVGGARLG